MTRKALRITDLADSDSMIRNQTIRNRTIVGPAVLVPMGPVELNGCGLPSPLQHFVWHLPADHPICGPIGLEDCKFIDCTFTTSVGFAEDAEFVADFIERMGHI